MRIRILIAITALILGLWAALVLTVTATEPPDGTPSHPYPPVMTTPPKDGYHLMDIKDLYRIIEDALEDLDEVVDNVGVIDYPRELGVSCEGGQLFIVTIEEGDPMKDPEFFVYYDTANGRPRRNFGRDFRAAMSWAQDNKDKNTEVIKCQSVWPDPESGSG